MGWIELVVHSPPWWGAGGAFVFAAPRWIACLVACREAGTPGWHCTGEFVVALLIGAFAAEAFSAFASEVLHMKDANAVSAMIGLLANPMAPRIAAGGAGIVGNLLNSKIGKALQGEDK